MVRWRLLRIHAERQTDGCQLSWPCALRVSLLVYRHTPACMVSYLCCGEVRCLNCWATAPNLQNGKQARAIATCLPLAVCHFAPTLHPSAPLHLNCVFPRVFRRTALCVRPHHGQSVTAALSCPPRPLPTVHSPTAHLHGSCLGSCLVVCVCVRILHILQCVHGLGAGLLCRTSIYQAGGYRGTACLNVYQAGGYHGTACLNAWACLCLPTPLSVWCQLNCETRTTAPDGMCRACSGSGCSLS